MGRPQLVEKVFSTSCLRFQNFQKVLKSIDLNGAGHPSWVPRAHPSFPFSCIPGFIDSLKGVPNGTPSACRKSLFDKLLQVFLNLKSSKKLMIENERHPSWVSFVTIFLPVAQDFRVSRQSEGVPNGTPFFISMAQWLKINCSSSSAVCTTVTAPASSSSPGAA